jgi:hypothetical protein
MSKQYLDDFELTNKSNFKNGRSEDYKIIFDLTFQDIASPEAAGEIVRLMHQDNICLGKDTFDPESRTLKVSCLLELGIDSAGLVGWLEDQVREIALTFRARTADIRSISMGVSEEGLTA